MDANLLIAATCGQLLLFLARLLHFLGRFLVHLVERKQLTRFPYLDDLGLSELKHGVYHLEKLILLRLGHLQLLVSRCRQ